MRTRACAWKYTRRYYRERENYIYITSDLFYSLINSNKVVAILINRCSIIVLWGFILLCYPRTILMMLRYGCVLEPLMLNKYNNDFFISRAQDTYKRKAVRD